MPADPDITRDIHDLVKEVVGNSPWLDQPNPNLGLSTPRSLIGTDRESLLRDLLRGIKHGAFS